MRRGVSLRGIPLRQSLRRRRFGRGFERVVKNQNLVRPTSDRKPRTPRTQSAQPPAFLDVPFLAQATRRVSEQSKELDRLIDASHRTFESP